MIRALAELGRPGEARGVLDGGDVEPTTGRLLSVAELQQALQAVRLTASDQTRLADAVAVPVALTSSTSAARTSAPVLAAARNGRLRPGRAQRWVAVVGAHGGAGTSTVALAIADAAATAGQTVHLVSCSEPGSCGLLAAASVELGVDVSGAWRTGRRGARTTIDRLLAQVDEPLWPALPPGDDVLTVVDVEAGAAGAPETLHSAAAVVLVCRLSVPGVQYAEQLLGPLLEHNSHNQGRPVLVAALGAGRWPGPVSSATGPLLRELQARKQVTAVPVERHLLTHGPTGRALPRSVARAGEALLRTATWSSPSPVPSTALAAATAAPGASEQSALESLFEKDTDR